mmetsp:Transcript_11603/g.25058  ORF Transcript_11603/g.25058 Transcript_11603/m.25058 type:complete len:608 (-) Transcript_11603:443-2266(-)
MQNALFQPGSNPAATQAAAAAAANSANTNPPTMQMQGGAPMKVEFGGASGTGLAAPLQPQPLPTPGPQNVPDSSPGRKTPGSRKNRNNYQQQMNFGMNMMPPPAGMPMAGSIDPQLLANYLNTPAMMQMMMSPAAFCGMAGMGPFPSGTMPGIYNQMPMVPNMGQMPTFPPNTSNKGSGKSGGGGGGGGGRGGKGQGNNSNNNAGNHNNSNNNSGGGGGGGGGERKRPNKRGAGGGKKNQEKAAEPVPENDGDDPDRSEKLNQVRREGGKSKMFLPEIMPHALEFAKDQIGSKFLQTKMEEATVPELEELFQLIIPSSIQLASDHVGNFVIQKFFDVGNLEQRKNLVQALSPQLVTLAKDTHGCRVVQKAISHVPRESQVLIAQKLKEDVAGCIDSMHGNHVIQKCIEQMPPDSVAFIIEAVQQEAPKMAAHMYGCRVVQRLLEHCAAHQLEQMLDAILSSINTLPTDNYGNYVVQHMLEHGRLEDKQAIVRVVEQNVVEYSKQKCSSNVVEKALEISAAGTHAAQLEEERASLVRKILGNPGDSDPPIRAMMEDKYGNFIVQRLIEHARGAEREQLFRILESSTQTLRNSNHGKHILNAFKKETAS